MNITENIQRIQQAKIDIRNAIIQKGVSVSDTLTIDNFADKILQIEGGGGGEDNLEKLLKNTLTSYNISNGITSIKPYAFYSATTLTSVTIPNSVTSIGNSAFNSCTSLSSVTIPNSVTSIGNSVFSGCTSLTSITIPNSVTSIGNSVFYSATTLTNVIIPNSVTSIGTNAFRSCKNLTSVTWNSSQQYIQDYTFTDCPKLRVLDLSGGATQVMRFGGATSQISGTANYIQSDVLQYIVIPDNLFDSWYASSYWRYFTEYLIKKSDYDAL